MTRVNNDRYLNCFLCLSSLSRSLIYIYYLSLLLFHVKKIHYCVRYTLMCVVSALPPHRSHPFSSLTLTEAVDENEIDYAKLAHILNQHVLYHGHKGSR